MKALQRKLRSRAGMTLTELLAAIAIMGLLGTAIGVGTGAATHVYRQSTAFSEAAVLASTLTEAIADELRYAADLPEADTEAPAFTSQTYGKGVAITGGTGDNAGHLMVGAHELVGARTYTSGLSAEAAIKWENRVFWVELTIADDSGATSKQVKFEIVPINR